MKEDKRQRSSATIYALWLALLCALCLVWRTLPWAVLLALVGVWRIARNGGQAGAQASTIK